jgi:hypothetical protein
MATPVKPGPNQQRATDNFFVQQVKWAGFGRSEKGIPPWRGGNNRQDTKICRPFFPHGCAFNPPCSLKWCREANCFVIQSLLNPPFVGIPLALALQNTSNMLSDLKGRLRMSPLMLMMLLTLVPFPILAIAIVANRWRKPASKAGA